MNTYPHEGGWGAAPPPLPGGHQGWKNSAIFDAVAASPGKDVRPNPSAMSRRVFWCWYRVVEANPVFALGLMAVQTIRPPPFVLSLLDSSNTTISNPSV